MLKTPDRQETIGLIRDAHRRRRLAMKIQQKLDRALESFIRVYGELGWDPDLDQKERDKINEKVKEIIKATRAGKLTAWADIVAMSDAARQPADELRARCEKTMEQLAKKLPVYDWVKTIRGAGELGLATIVAEAGDLGNYSNPAKLWKRLGFAPYDGYAGSSWKRYTWVPRKLTAEEWIENPFSGERYALMHQIAVWLVNAQWVGKAKTGTGEGKPNGPYGKVYADRRAHTAKTHADWTKQHSKMDGLRVAMKAFLKDLHVAWNKPLAKKKVAK